MKRLNLAYCSLALALALFGIPPSAHAAWQAPVEGRGQLLGYGAEYSGRVHRGVDIAGDSGTPVSAPTGGTVAFAGAVPGDGGGTCGAVTIETEDGLRISLLPLENVLVSAGQLLDAGDVVASLAASGDDSSQEPHLHIGLRRGETYLDPSAFLPSIYGQTGSESLEAQAPAAITPPAPSVTSAPPISPTVITPAAPSPSPAPALAATPLSQPAPLAVGPVDALAPAPHEEKEAVGEQPGKYGRSASIGFKAPASTQSIIGAVLLLGMLATGVALWAPQLVHCRA